MTDRYVSKGAMKFYVLSALLGLLCGCMSNTARDGDTAAAERPLRRGVKTPAETSPGKSLTRAVIVVVAAATPKNSESQRKYIGAIAEEVLARLKGDPTITTLPSSVSDSATAGLSVPGFANAGELKEVVSKLPPECNMIILVGPYPDGTERDRGFPVGSYPVGVLRRGDLTGCVTCSNPADKSEIKILIQLIRMDIDLALKGQ